MKLLLGYNMKIVGGARLSKACANDDILVSKFFLEFSLTNLGCNYEFNWKKLILD